MTEPSYGDFYSQHPPSYLTRAEELEYAAYYPDGIAPEPEQPDALTALTQASDAIDAGNLYPSKETA